MFQDILKYDNNELFLFITKIINNDYKISELKKCFPNDILFFQLQIDYLKSIHSNNLNKSLQFYKNLDFYLINLVITFKKFPLVYLVDKFSVNKDLRYLFPDDMHIIKENYQNKIINSIHNLDFIILNNKPLPNCILFRGFKNFISDNINNNFTKLTHFKYEPIIFKKNKIITFDSFQSYSFNPLVSKNFLDLYSTSKNFENIFFIVRIKSSHNIPAIFLSNIYFNKNIKFNNFHKLNNEEFEIVISRNVQFKILSIKKININKLHSTGITKINNIYNDKINNIIPIKIILLESLPFIKPEPFNILSNTKYVCSNVTNTYK